MEGCASDSVYKPMDVDGRLDALETLAEGWNSGQIQPYPQIKPEAESAGPEVSPSDPDADLSVNDKVYSLLAYAFHDQIEMSLSQKIRFGKILATIKGKEEGIAGKVRQLFRQLFPSEIDKKRGSLYKNINSSYEKVINDIRTQNLEQVGNLTGDADQRNWQVIKKSVIPVSFFDTKRAKARKLEVACREGDIGMVRVLTQRAGVPDNTGQLFGTQPLLAALRNKHVEVVKELIKNDKFVTTEFLRELGGRDGLLDELVKIVPNFASYIPMDKLAQYIPMEKLLPVLDKINLPGLIAEKERQKNFLDAIAKMPTLLKKVMEEEPRLLDPVLSSDLMESEGALPHILPYLSDDHLIECFNLNKEAVLRSAAQNPQAFARVCQLRGKDIVITPFDWVRAGARIELLLEQYSLFDCLCDTRVKIDVEGLRKNRKLFFDSIRRSLEPYVSLKTVINGIKQRHKGFDISNQIWFQELPKSAVLPLLNKEELEKLQKDSKFLKDFGEELEGDLTWVFNLMSSLFTENNEEITKLAWLSLIQPGASASVLQKLQKFVIEGGWTCVSALLNDLASSSLDQSSAKTIIAALESRASETTMSLQGQAATSKEMLGMAEALKKKYPQAPTT